MQRVFQHCDRLSVCAATAGLLRLAPGRALLHETALAGDLHRGPRGRKKAPAV